MEHSELSGRRVNARSPTRVSTRSRQVKDGNETLPRGPATSALTPTTVLALQAVAGNQSIVTLLAAGPVSTPSTALPIQRDSDPDYPSWTTLSAPVRAQAEQLYDECDDSIGVMNEAQLVRVSSTRSSWLSTLRKIRSRIETVDADQKLDGVRNAYRDVDRVINRVSAAARAEWTALENRYLDEHRWLLSTIVKSTDTVEAAKYLEQIYGETKPSVPFLTTDDDFLLLKQTMDKQEYVRVGALRGTRIRVKKLQQMMRTVADLTRKGEDAAKFIPEWKQRVHEETVYLESFAAVATSQGRDYGKELAELRGDLLRQQQETEAIRPPKDSVLGNGAAVIKGAVEAFVGIFVEAAKEVVDLVQINLHFMTMGHYEPKFVSDMAKAAEQGATTGDLLKGMVTGMIETPGRFLKACRDGDWEAIGRESVHLYLLAKTLKEAPETVRKAANAASRLPELIARTNESLRILRQRTVALGLKQEGRFSPEPARSRPTPELTVRQGGGEGTGKPTGTLRDSDAPGRGVQVDASHPVLKNKTPANQNEPRQPQAAEAVKVAVNGPSDVPPGKPLPQQPGAADPGRISAANKKGGKKSVADGEEGLRGAEHTKGKRGSTAHDHEVGQSRKKADQEGADQRRQDAASTARTRQQTQTLGEIRRAARNLPDKIQEFHRDARKPELIRLADLKQRLLDANSPTNVDMMLKDAGLTQDQLIRFLRDEGMFPPER